MARGSLDAPECLEVRSYVPHRHCKQTFHGVHHRLCNHGAGVRLDYAAADPDVLAEAIACNIGRSVSYRDVATDGAARAAASIAALL